MTCSAIVEDGLRSARCQGRPDFLVPEFSKQTLATLISLSQSPMAKSSVHCCT